MSKHDFDFDEFQTRRQLVREAMYNQGMDVLLIIHPVCLHWLTGTDTKSYQSFQCLIFSAKDSFPLIILTRESERAEYVDDAFVDEIRTFAGPEPSDPIELLRDTLNEFSLSHQRIGLEVPAFYLHPHHYVRILDLLGDNLKTEQTTLIHSLKAVKSSKEIQYIRIASQIADQAMQACIGTVRPGLSELELSAQVYNTLLSNGSGIPASPINLVSGDRMCFSHGMPTHRLLRHKDDINVEFGATWKRYTATIGRQLCLGSPSARMQEIFEVCLASCDACIATIRDGVPAIEPHLAAKKVIAEAGFNRYRIHTTGYGIAPGTPPSWGEPLNMYGDSADVLKAGMVVSVEPPIYIHEERIGVRVIDNVLVTTNGCELLSNVTRNLVTVPS